MHLIKRIVLFLGISLVICILVFFVMKHIRKESIHKQTRFLMDTYCTIQATGQRKPTIHAISLALDRMEEVDKKFNVLNPKSPLFDFNNNNIPLEDEEILGVCSIAQMISEESGGAFDVTVYPLIKLWGFYGDSPSLPDRKEITQCLKKIGYKDLNIQNGSLKKINSNIMIDLGGIAKGYAINEALKILKKEGITSALIDAGGDIYALGEFKGKPWKVGIRRPRGEGVMGVLDVSDLSVVTSGDYERFFEKDGIRYHHLLDPKTGYPAKELISVTVLSSNPVFADAWSTALFIMGKKKGMDIVERTATAEALMVTAKGEILYSSGLKDNLEIIKKEKRKK